MTAVTSAYAPSPTRLFLSRIWSALPVRLRATLAKGVQGIAMLVVILVALALLIPMFCILPFVGFTYYGCKAYVRLLDRVGLGDSL